MPEAYSLGPISEPHIIRSHILTLISVDEFSATPKHLQLAQGILAAIESGAIKTNDTLPSLNELKDHFDISRDTAEKCYKSLRETGVLGSVPGKGYYISNTLFRHEIKILLLFNKLSARKQLIYDAFVQELDGQAAIDFYIYNNDLSIFKKLIEERKDFYSHYVIIPHFSGNYQNSDIPVIINTVPSGKLILLDKDIVGINGKYGLVYEHFENDIYQALRDAITPLMKYHTLKLVFPGNSYYPNEIIRGFRNFCQDYAFTAKVVDDIAHEPLTSGETFICLQEDDLVLLVERLVGEGFTIGTDIGVISYNETPLKKLILNGITTISTDFQMMGRRAAEMIIYGNRDRVELPFCLTLRASV